MGAPSKKAQRIRRAEEFDLTRIAHELREPAAGSAVFSWSLAEIFEARSHQMLGMFQRAARLSEGMATDDALFVALEDRVAPSRCLRVEILAAKGARADSVAAEGAALFGDDGLGISAETVRSVHKCLVQHGIAFAYNVPTVRGDGSRIDLAAKYWPIEFVDWSPWERGFFTQTAAGARERITHGDGRWVVFRAEEVEPFKSGCIVPGSLVWAAHAFGRRDWSKGANTHGLAKIVGELPPGLAIQQADGSALTPEAAAFLAVLKQMATGEAPVGLRPAGSKTEFVTNTSSAWQIFKELVGNTEGAAARIYLGTDGTLGSRGGAPGVDINALFGIARTFVEGDIKAIQRGFAEGTIEPWAALNFGSSALAPKRRYLLPDVDEDAARESYAKRVMAFYEEIRAARDLGFAVSQDFVNETAKRHGVKPPLLAAPEGGGA